MRPTEVRIRPPYQIHNAVRRVEEEERAASEGRFSCRPYDLPVAPLDPRRMPKASSGHHAIDRVHILPECHRGSSRCLRTRASEWSRWCQSPAQEIWLGPAFLRQSLHVIECLHSRFRRVCPLMSAEAGTKSRPCPRRYPYEPVDELSLDRLVCIHSITISSRRDWPSRFKLEAVPACFERGPGFRLPREQASEPPAISFAGGLDWELTAPFRLESCRPRPG